MPKSYVAYHFEKAQPESKGPMMANAIAILLKRSAMLNVPRTSPMMRNKMTDSATSSISDSSDEPKGSIRLEDLAVVDAGKSTIEPMKRKLDKMRFEKRY